MLVQKIKFNNSGFSLVLSVLILANLLMITFIVTDVILRTGKSSQQIGQSEIAYLAAESSIERAIYQIEQNKNASNLGTSVSPTTGELNSTAGNWQSYMTPIYNTRITCVDDQQRITFPTDPDAETDKSCIYAEDLSQNTLTRLNPLLVRLRPGKSFEIDFNISTAPGSNYYSGAVVIDWSPVNHTGQVVVLSPTGQSAFPTTPANRNLRVPPSPDIFGDSPDYRIRIMNNSSGDVIYTIGPRTGNEILIVAISVTSQGYYDVDKNERVIVAERRLWEIY